MKWMNDWRNGYWNVCHEYWFGILPESPVFSDFRFNHCDKHRGWRTWSLPRGRPKGHLQCDLRPRVIRAGVAGLREETLRCDQEECYPFLDIPTATSWWQEAEHTAWRNAKHLGSKPSRQVAQIKEKLTADSSHAYYVHPDSHGDVDIMCIFSSQIPLLSVPDVWCYINPRVMF